ncbi:MAG: bifunctional diaminohydroxyphosphoribosylaminopyrimidine deaminase/5-amino-6-(5-phosphoribosylamino)uracil reductase RibD [Nitrospirota bacterium]
MTDEFYMRRTIMLARRAQGMTSPNPLVGAIIVKNERIIAEDYHKKAGNPHAEALVIEKVGTDAIDSILYVNLEPCCHTEKRTPPCTKTIINAGIKKVVIGMIDPNPNVLGRGIAELRDAGMDVEVGVLENEARWLNEAYIKYITAGKPFVTLKVAMTLDGKIATPEGQSKWITGEKSRKLVHRLRGTVDAIVTAIGTVKADDPLLTARIKGGKSPARIIIDPDLEISLNAQVLRVPPKTYIITSKTRDSQLNNSPSPPFIKGGQRGFSRDEKIKTLLDMGVQIITYEGENLDLNWLMKTLGEKEIISVLIEGGSSLNYHALEDGIVDKVMFFISPKIIGGKESFPAVGGRNFRKLEEAIKIKDLKVRRVGEDILLEGYPTLNLNLLFPLKLTR